MDMRNIILVELKEMAKEFRRFRSASKATPQREIEAKKEMAPGTEVDKLDTTTKTLDVTGGTTYPLESAPVESAVESPVESAVESPAKTAEAEASDDESEFEIEC